MKGLKTRFTEGAVLTENQYKTSDEEMRMLKKTLLEILQDILIVCEKYNIQVALAGGSALGAVRHKGFIPWDDDLDLLMPRDGYNRFHEVFEKELGERYYIAAPNQDGLYKMRFPKVFMKDTVYRALDDVDSKLPCGIFVDIFIVENVPDNKLHRALKGALCNFLMLCGSKEYMYEQNNEVLRNHLSGSEKGAKAYERDLMLGKMLSFVPARKWFDWIDKAVQFAKKSRDCGIPTGRKHYFGEILHAEDFFPAISGEFEGLTVPLPANCDKYLSNLYGNYMEIPPVEKQEKHYVVELKFPAHQ